MRTIVTLIALIGCTSDTTTEPHPCPPERIGEDWTHGEGICEPGEWLGCPVGSEVFALAHCRESGFVECPAGAAPVCLPL